MKRQAGNGRELRPNCHKNQLITRGRLLETVYRRPECTHQRPDQQQFPAALAIIWLLKISFSFDVTIFPRVQSKKFCERARFDFHIELKLDRSKRKKLYSSIYSVRVLTIMRSIKAFIVFINIFTGIRSEDGQFGRLEKKIKEL